MTIPNKNDKLKWKATMNQSEEVLPYEELESPEELLGCYLIHTMFISYN